MIVGEPLPDLSPLLRAFCAGTLEPAAFHHAQHVEVAFEMLGHHGFAECAAAYSCGLKAVAAKAGRPQLYHETVTLAFLSLIAEAKGAGIGFAEAHERAPHLFRKGALAALYSPERLNSPTARTTFLLPDKAGRAG